MLTITRVAYHLLTSTTQHLAEIWRGYRAGNSLRSISRTMGRSMEALRALVASTGGRPPVVPRRSPLRLSLAEREEVPRGVVAGDSCRLMARRLRRAPSTVSREFTSNGGRLRYRAYQAEQAAWRRARRPKSAKLLSCLHLRQVVEAKLVSRWSPRANRGLAGASLSRRSGDAGVPRNNLHVAVRAATGRPAKGAGPLPAHAPAGPATSAQRRQLMDKVN